MYWSRHTHTHTCHTHVSPSSPICWLSSAQVGTTPHPGSMRAVSGIPWAKRAPRLQATAPFHSSVCVFVGVWCCVCCLCVPVRVLDAGRVIDLPIRTVHVHGVSCTASRSSSCPVVSRPFVLLVFTMRVRLEILFWIFQGAVPCFRISFPPPPSSPPLFDFV